MARPKSTAPTGAPSRSNSSVILDVTREEIQKLVDDINTASCIVDSVRGSLRGTGYEEGALRQALCMIGNVASELDAAVGRAQA